MVKEKCPSADTVKQLEAKQANLDFNQIKFMELLREVRDDVKELKKFIFEGGMAQGYVSREAFENRIANLEQQIIDKDEQIKALQSNQNKVAWFIIFAVLSAVVGLVIIPKI